jgi:hypothetical protein
MENMTLYVVTQEGEHILLDDISARPDLINKPLLMVECDSSDWFLCPIDDAGVAFCPVSPDTLVEVDGSDGHWTLVYGKYVGKYLEAIQLTEQKSFMRYRIVEEEPQQGESSHALLEDIIEDAVLERLRQLEPQCSGWHHPHRLWPCKRSTCRF